MSRKIKLVRIFISLVIAFLITINISNMIFINQSPEINTIFVATLPQTIGSAFISALSFFNGPKDSVPSPTAIPQPTETPVVFITSPPVNTIIPTHATSPLSPTPIKNPTLPPITKPTPSSSSCPTTSSNLYDAISVGSGHTTNAATHPDINLSVRGYSKNNETLSLVDVGSGDDDGARAPQFSTLFSQKRGPNFISTYQVSDWNWNTNMKGTLLNNPVVTLLGIQTKSGESIHVPASQYNIGEGKQVMVLYADANSVTIKYTREDNMVGGYGIHIDGICVDPQLLKLYISLNAAGRSSLPGLAGGQQLGVAISNEVRVAIRDTGTFMDPRVRKDWWVGY